MSVYESLKADLDYLLLPRAAEVFAPLATEAKRAAGATSSTWPR